MSLESRPVSGERRGSLQSCLVEGDPEQRLRERRVRRRALVISIAMQSTVLAALVVIPLFARPARIALNAVPVPPYYHSTRQRTSTTEIHPPRQQHNVCRVCPTMPLAPTIPTHDTPAEIADVPGVPIPDVPEIPGGIRMPDPRDGLRAPPPRQPRAETSSHVVHTTHIDPALLIHRVEPVYPILAKQLGRSGRVELHAIIATDGTIQSLQAVGGDPMFYPSALEAVGQWRYTPTVLNGQVMEVDTYITVIYNIAR
jgi:TonB family protein